MLWFLDTLVSIPTAHEDGANGISVIDSLAPCGDSAPYHVHEREDEVFHVLEGELVVLLGEMTSRLRAGETALLPRGVPHTYRVVSERAHWLCITTNGEFERFVRELSRPAEGAELPPPGGPPTPEQQAALAEAGRRNGIELLGPPLSADVAQAA
jgi:quercetin dioxygenase-like cupin family protein